MVLDKHDFYFGVEVWKSVLQCKQDSKFFVGDPSWIGILLVTRQERHTLEKGK